MHIDTDFIALLKTVFAPLFLFCAIVQFAGTIAFFMGVINGPLISGWLVTNIASGIVFLWMFYGLRSY